MVATVPASTLTWEQTSEFLREVINLYQNPDTDDVSDAEFISRSTTELCKGAEDLRDSLSEQVRVTTEQVNEEETRLEAENLGEYENKMALLRRREEAINAQVSEIESQKAELQAQIEKATEEAKSCTEAMEAVEAQKMNDIPRIKHAISLFKSISGINFKHDSEGETVSGTMAVPGTDDLMPFDFNTRNVSAFEITQKLWGYMNNGPAAE